MRNRYITIGVVAILTIIAVIGITLMNQAPPQAAQGTPTAAQSTSAPVQGSTPTATPTNEETLLSTKNTAITTEEIAYFQTNNGYYAAPQAPGNYPGVVMIHEWWGLNDHIKGMAKTLAKEGYHVIAVDLFKGTVAQTSQEAQAQTSSLVQTEAVQNLQGAVAFLRSKNATKIASLGWCFGGGQSMQLSVSGEALDATVIYYGNLETDNAKLANIKWPVLGIFADQDQSITPDKVKAFEGALNNLSVTNSITIYPGVGHAFANPSGQAFAETETKDAWGKTLTFLAENLK